MVDSLGTWLTATVDRFGTWDRPLAGWQDRFDAELSELTAAWRAHPGPAVAVTHEVGWGLVAEYRSGRTFADLLGLANQAMAGGERRGDHGRCRPAAAVVRRRLDPRQAQGTAR